MESITRLVSESLARHGFDRPLDYRRLHWSRWFRCESTHSLLVVPSKPGVFALAEEIVPAPTEFRDATEREGDESTRADKAGGNYILLDGQEHGEKENGGQGDHKTKGKEFVSRTMGEQPDADDWRGQCNQHGEMRGIERARLARCIWEWRCGLA